MNFIALDKQSKTPLYQQLIDSFLKAIEQNLLRPEDRRPSEEMLCHSFNISRSVVKLAYDELEANSIIQRTPKGGTFVARNNRYQTILNQVPFFLEALKRSKLEWTHTINLNEVVDGQRHLKISYFIDAIPMIVSDLYISEQIPFDVKEDWTILISDLEHVTQFKSVVLNKVDAQFFNKTEAFVVYDFLTSFTQDGIDYAILHQWVSPMMGQLKIEVRDGY